MDRLPMSGKFYCSLAMGYYFVAIKRSKVGPGEGGMNRGTQRAFREVKILCMILL